MSARPAPEAEVAAALRDVAALGPYFAIEVGEAAGTWWPVTRAYASGLSGVIADTAATLRTGEARVAASLAQFGHAARLWSPVLGCAVAHHVVPDLTGLEHSRSGPVALRLRSPAGWYAPEPGALAGLLYRVVVTDQLEPLAAGLKVRVAPGLLWGNAASALAGAAHVLTEARPEVREFAASLVRRLLGTGRLRGTGHVIGPDSRFRRRSCCLYYRVPGGGTCADCALSAAPR
jgi:hypothetical protein